MNNEIKHLKNQLIASSVSNPIIWLFWVLTIISLNSIVLANPDTLQISCHSCHYCPEPTKQEPCLFDCPREKMKDAQASGSDVLAQLSMVPDIIRIDRLEQIYVPVDFNHKLHGRMVAHTHGCARCHHNAEGTQITACRECHSAESVGGSLDSLNLKGAYHRQCLSCHRELDHATKCETCHALKSSPTRPHPADSTVPPAHHSILVQDEVIQFSHSFNETQIRFSHKVHATSYGLSCNQCHEASQCQPCHTAPGSKLQEGKPKNTKDCLSCHSDSKCDLCHQPQEKIKEFNHETTGFSLSRWHASVSCSGCHGSAAQHMTPSSDCLKCHRSDDFWKKFTHDRTGLVLDGIHKDFSCDDCHPGKRFNSNQCTKCHDAAYTYPSIMPGAITRSNSLNPPQQDYPGNHQ